MKDGRAPPQLQEGSASSWQKLVDSGEAATLEEAGKILSKRAYDARRQKLADSGEAATLEEAGKILNKRDREARRQKLVDSGEAATRED